MQNHMSFVIKYDFTIMPIAIIVFRLSSFSVSNKTKPAIKSYIADHEALHYNAD